MVFDFNTGFQLFVLSDVQTKAHPLCIMHNLSVVFGYIWHISKIGGVFLPSLLLLGRCHGKIIGIKLYLKICPLRDKEGLKGMGKA